MGMEKGRFLIRLFFVLALCCGMVSCSDDKETEDDPDRTEENDETGSTVNVPGPKGEKDEGVDGIYAVGKCWHYGEVIGMVYAVSDGGRHGKVLSLKQWRGAWKGTPPDWTRDSDGKSLGWKTPTMSELSSLWCAFNGKSGTPSSSEKIDTAAQEIFNRNLERLGGMPMATGPSQNEASYWSNERNQEGQFGTYTVKCVDFNASRFGDAYFYINFSPSFDFIVHRYVYDF